MGAAVAAVPESLAVEMNVEVEHAVGLKAIATAYVVESQEDADSLAAWRNQLDSREKAVVEKLAPAKKAAHEAHRRICDLENDAVVPLREAKGIANRKLGAWQAEQERIANQKRRDEEARLRRIEEDARIAEAAKLEEVGEVEQAHALIEEPIVTPVAVVSKPTVQGVQFRETWSAQVTDLAKFLKAVADVPAFHGLVMVNTTALNQMARAQKANLSIPGVKPVSDKQVARGR